MMTIAEIAEWDACCEGSFLEDLREVRRYDPDAPRCHCGASAILRDDRYVYGRTYGRKLWVCSRFPECDSYVGTHPDDSPLGTLADKDLRDARGEAHAAFDPLWRNGGPMKRYEAYRWLAHAMGMSIDEAHIAMFDADQCADVVVRAKMKRNRLAQEAGA